MFEPVKDSMGIQSPFCRERAGPFSNILPIWSASLPQIQEKKANRRQKTIARSATVSPAPTRAHRADRSAQAAIETLGGRPRPLRARPMAERLSTNMRLILVVRSPCSPYLRSMIPPPRPSNSHRVVKTYATIAACDECR
jgi:hypothetical protein